MSPPDGRGEGAPVHRVMVGTDRSETADRAVRWAADLADRWGAELLIVQVMVRSAENSSDAASAVAVETARRELARLATELAGTRGAAQIVCSDDPAGALLETAAGNEVDTLVVGNVGMRGRKKFLLGNIPNRISHNAACNVIIVNTAGNGLPPAPPHASESSASVEEIEPHLIGRAAEIGAIVARHGIEEVFAKYGGDGSQESQAKRLRTALEELGPTFAKLGQVLSTRPDLLPSSYVAELAGLQDHCAPMTEAEVVEVMETELGVPWEDVFESIDPEPLAAGTIAQVHRAKLESGDKVVVKVQRPRARPEIMEDLALLEMFAERTRSRPVFSHIVDMPAVFEHLSESLQRELDFRREAANLRRFSVMFESYSRLAVPKVYDDLSTSRLLVMEEVEGRPVREAPMGEERRDAARQLLESYYQQILTEGFFHADPHPGNMLWWNDRIYFLDFGMVGELGQDLRENVMLLLLAFWQEDIGFLTDVTLMIAGCSNRSDIDVEALHSELGALVASYRGASLRDIQLGPILQEMTAISIRHDMPLPSSLTLTAKAMAQMQLTAAELDPDLDPFQVAGTYLMRTMIRNVRETISPKWLFYESQKLKVRAVRILEAFERLTGARAGPRPQVNFRAERLEEIVHQTGRRLSLAAVASAALVGAARLASAGTVSSRAPLALGALGSAIAVRLLIDEARDRG